MLILYFVYTILHMCVVYVCVLNCDNLSLEISDKLNIKQPTG